MEENSKSNDSEFYDLNDPKMIKAWNMLNGLPTFILKRLKKKSFKDMKRNLAGATGAYHMTCDILNLKK